MASRNAEGRMPQRGGYLVRGCPGIQGQHRIEPTQGMGTNARTLRLRAELLEAMAERVTGVHPFARRPQERGIGGLALDRAARLQVL